jgi:hypothetical protein
LLTLQLFLKDKSLLSAVSIILFLEIIMQMGCYKPFQKKSSYAQSVNRITDTAVSTLPTLKPNLLIIGTSIAYEGISIERLNEKIKDRGFVAQSIAIPGSELIVQELALRKILKENSDIKYIVHVNELQFPWIDRRALIEASLSMITELNRWEAIQKLEEDRYLVEWADYAYLFVRWVSYKKDIADMLLRPDKRWKEFARGLKRDSENPYAYANEYTPSLSHFQFDTIGDCMFKTSPGSLIPEGSNKHHIDAVHKTCKLVHETKLPLDSNELTELFKLRLSNFYKYINSKNIKIINVYPPVNTHLNPEDNELRREFWEKEFSDSLQNQKFNLSDVIPRENNSDYYYDVIHLNKRGMEMFTDSLAESILKHVI